MTPARCPRCGKRFRPDESRAMPFCSERCRLVDLGRWIDERYGLPRVSDEEDASPPDWAIPPDPE